MYQELREYGCWAQLNTMKFSQRIGKTSIRDSLQVESIDKKLENRLWNTILKEFVFQLENDTSSYGHKSQREQLCELIWEEFFGNRIDEIPARAFDTNTKAVIEYIKDWFVKSEWYEKYDLLEFLNRIDIQANLNLRFEDNCNQALKREMAGYRLSGKNIVQITSEEEIIEIEEAIERTSKWGPVSSHINSAVKIFSNRTNTDYKNVIKESISAVESLCKIITQNDKATLGEALKEIEKKYKLHGALKSAFNSLYGYTSDSGGIRHGLLTDDIEVTFEDAKFMLVSCSAFINYLITKEEKQLHLTS